LLTGNAAEIKIKIEILGTKNKEPANIPSEPCIYKTTIAVGFAE
jgi:hypothetical protein